MRFMKSVVCVLLVRLTVCSDSVQSSRGVVYVECEASPLAVFYPLCAPVRVHEGKRLPAHVTLGLHAFLDDWKPECIPALRSAYAQRPAKNLPCLNHGLACGKQHMQLSKKLFRRSVPDALCRALEALWQACLGSPNPRCYRVSRYAKFCTNLSNRAQSVNDAQRTLLTNSSPYFMGEPTSSVL